MKEREIVKKDMLYQVTLLKDLTDLTLKNLYEDKCPIELYEEISRHYGHPDFDCLLIITEDDLDTCVPECIKNLHKWFIDNGYIEEVTQDIELKPGMVLRNDTGREYIVLEDGRLYYGKGWKFISDVYEDGVTYLSEVNGSTPKANKYYFNIVEF